MWLASEAAAPWKSSTPQDVPVRLEAGRVKADRRRGGGRRFGSRSEVILSSSLGRVGSFEGGKQEKAEAERGD